MCKKTNITGCRLPACALAAAALLGGFSAVSPVAGQTVINYGAPVADTYVSGQSPGTNYGGSVGLTVRNGPDAGRTRKTYIKFDLFSGGHEASFDGMVVSDAEFTIHFAGFGTPAVPEVTYTIYGLSHTYHGGDGLLGQDWAENALTSNNAPWGADRTPVPAYLTALGTFTMPGSANAPASNTGFSISGPALDAFLNASLSSGEPFSNLVTFVVYLGPSNSGGDTTWFGKGHATGTAPSLKLTVAPIPESSVVGSSAAIVALGVVLCARRRRRAGRE